MAEEKSGSSQRDEDSGRDVGVSEMPKEWRSGKLVVIVIPEEPDAIPESRRDYSRPFWVGTPVE